jgi:putative methionine-R-sulfoxide reductase with GAF domain
MECVKNKVEKVCDVHKFFGSLKCCSSVKVEIKK